MRSYIYCLLVSVVRLRMREFVALDIFLGVDLKV